jgi:hypothetical protein
MMPSADADDVIPEECPAIIWDARGGDCLSPYFALLTPEDIDLMFANMDKEERERQPAPPTD